MERAVIIVKGDVQRVGYRDEVERIARKLGVNGFIGNLKPHDVRIICEGEESAIKQFMKDIRIQAYPIFVEKIEAVYENATGEFKYFEIKRGAWQDELAERFDVAGRMLYSLNSGQNSMLEKQDIALEKQDSMLEKQDTMIEKQDKMLEKQDIALEKQDSMLEKQDKMLEKQDIMITKQDENTAALKSFAGETSQSFAALDSKYHIISEALTSVLQEFRQERKELFSEIIEGRKENTQMMGKLVEAIIKSRK